MLSLSVKMYKTCFTFLCLVISPTCTLPQFFSIGIGFGSDDNPITFHSSQQPQSQSQQPLFQPQQTASHQQESRSQPAQPSFPSQQPSFQPQRPEEQQQQQRFQFGEVTAAPPPARSAPAPPLVRQQDRDQVRQQRPPKRVFSSQAQPPSERPRQSQQQQQQQQRPQNNAESHQEALERNALHRKQLAEVIEAHNEKVFGDFGNEIAGSIEDTSEDINEVKQDVLPSSAKRISIPKRRPADVGNFVGKSTPTTKFPTSLKKKLPDSIRDDILAHLDLINKLDKQVNELVRKASRVFAEQEKRALAIRKQEQEERRKKTKDLEEDD